MTFIWLTIIIAGVFIDISTSGFLFSTFSLGALGALIISMFVKSVVFQIIAFLVLSIIAILTIMPIVKKALNKEGDKFIVQEDRILGRVITLDKDVVNTEIISIDGVFWTVKAVEGPVKVGEKIIVVSKEGNKFLVKKYEGEN